MANAARIEADILALKGITEPCPAGVTRIGFTPTYRNGAELFKEWMAQAGLGVREDSIGNVYGRMEGSLPGAPVILSGSHLDTVRCAGAYDGVAGAVCALEVARMLRENGVTLRHPYEVMGVIEEEGTRFGQVLLGSKFVTGVFGEGELDRIRDEQGTTLRQVLSGYVHPEAVPARRSREDCLAVLELHDEQGPVLEAEGVDVGIVERIVAISWLTVTVTGFAGHAGTVPMPLRRDAAWGACRLVDRILTHTKERYPQTATATVGRLEVQPGSSNCIPASCTFTVDLRSGKLATVEELTDFIRAQARAVEAECDVTIDVQVGSKTDAIELDGRLREVLARSCDTLGITHRPLNSGAGHDAMVFSGHWPTAMLFVPCAKGVTHNPAEYVSPEQLARGADVLYQAVLTLDRE